MALTDKLTAIADAIRSKTGKTAKMSIDKMKDEISSVKTVKSFLNARTVKFLFYGLNYETIPDTVMDSLDLTGVKDMRDMFNGCSTLTTIPKIDTSNVTHTLRMFNNCSSLTTIPQLNMSKVVTCLQMFNACSSLTEIPPLDTRNATNMYKMFSGCRSLNTISKLDMRSVTEAGGIVLGCASLENCSFVNIKTSLQLSSGTQYGHLLTVESLLFLIKELIATNSELELTIGVANLNKLSNVYVKLISVTDEMKAEDEFIHLKRPFEVCESTDEGAMLITDYVRLKKWTLK